MKPELECFVSGTLATVLRVSRYVGLAPITFRRQGTGWRVRLSPYLNIYAYVLISCINVLTLISLVKTQTVKRFTFYMWTNTRHIFGIVDTCIIMALSAAAGYGARGHMRSMIHCFNQLKKVNCELLITHWPKWIEKKKLIVFVFWMVFTTILLLIDQTLIILIMRYDAFNDFVTSKRHVSSPDDNHIMLYALYFCNYWIQQLEQIQFIMIALHVLYTFRTINEDLKNVLQDILELKRSSVLLPRVVEKDFHCILEIYEKSKDEVTSIETASSSKLSPEDFPKYPEEKVRALASAYASVCDVVREVNRSHGRILFLILGFSFFRLVITPFYFLVNFFDNKSFTATTNTYTYVQLMWSLWHAASIILLIEPCHMTLMEMESTRVLVSHLMCCTRSSYEPLSVELETFYRHLVLNTVYYSPLGVTIMRRSLLATIFGSITTYLVVIVQ